MLPNPTTDSPDKGVPAAHPHPHPEFGAARVALALSDFSPDDLDAFACVASTLRDVDEGDIHADVARLAVKLAALPPLTRWAATVINRYWTQPEGTRLAYVVHFSWSHYPSEAVDEIARVTAAFDWKKPPPAPLPSGPPGAYRAIVDIMNMTTAGKARARQFVEVMEASALRAPTADSPAQHADGDHGDSESDSDSETSSAPAAALAVIDSGSEVGGSLDDQSFAALVAPGAMETEPDHRFAGLAVFAAGTAAAGGAAATAVASGSGGAAATGAAAVAAAVVACGAVTRRRFQRRSAITEPAIEAIAASASSDEAAAALTDGSDDTDTDDTETGADEAAVAASADTDDTDTDTDDTGHQVPIALSA